MKIFHEQKCIKFYYAIKNFISVHNNVTGFHHFTAPPHFYFTIITGTRRRAGTLEDNCVHKVIFYNNNFVENL